MFVSNVIEYFLVFLFRCIPVSRHAYEVVSGDDDIFLSFQRFIERPAFLLPLGFKSPSDLLT